MSNDHVEINIVDGVYTETRFERDSGYYYDGTGLPLRIVSQEDMTHLPFMHGEPPELSETERAKLNVEEGTPTESIWLFHRHFYSDVWALITEHELNQKGVPIKHDHDLLMAIKDGHVTERRVEFFKLAVRHNRIVSLHEPNDFNLFGHFIQDSSPNAEAYRQMRMRKKGEHNAPMWQRGVIDGKRDAEFISGDSLKEDKLSPKPWDADYEGDDWGETGEEFYINEKGEPCVIRTRDEERVLIEAHKIIRISYPTYWAILDENLKPIEKARGATSKVLYRGEWQTYLGMRQLSRDYTRVWKEPILDSEGRWKKDEWGNVMYRRLPRPWWNEKARLTFLNKLRRRIDHCKVRILAHGINNAGYQFVRIAVPIPAAWRKTKQPFNKHYPEARWFQLDVSRPAVVVRNLLHTMNEKLKKVRVKAQKRSLRTKYEPQKHKEIDAPKYKVHARVPQMKLYCEKCGNPIGKDRLEHVFSVDYEWTVYNTATGNEIQSYDWEDKRTAKAQADLLSNNNMFGDKYDLRMSPRSYPLFMFNDKAATTFRYCTHKITDKEGQLLKLTFCDGTDVEVVTNS